MCLHRFICVTLTTTIMSTRLLLLTIAAIFCCELSYSQQTIELDEIIVTNNRDLTRKERKERDKTIFRIFKERLEKDFKQLDGTTFQVDSKLNITQEGASKINNHTKAKYVEYYNINGTKKDTIAIHYNHVDYYIDNQLKEEFGQMSKERADQKSHPDYIDRGREVLDDNFYAQLNSERSAKSNFENINRGVWWYNRDARESLSYLTEDMKKWKIEEGIDNITLTHIDNTNVLGMVKIENHTTFIVNRRDYSLQKMKNRIYVQVSIPIGYKLPKDMVPLLNIIYQGDEELKKFRLRHLRISGTSSTDYKSSLAGHYPSLRVGEMSFWMQDNKKHVIRGEMQGTLNVWQ